MVLDTAATQMAITERMIKRESERIGQEKDYMKESQKAILDALSYEAVLGASDNMQMKHLENVNALESKWADVYAQSDGKLSMQQLAELKKDQRKVEAERMNMQTNVRNFELTREAMLNDPQGKLWTPESFEKFAQYVKEGKVGDPTVDWMGVLSPRVRDLPELLYDELSGYRENALANVDIGQINVNEDGSINWGENNFRALTENFNALFNSRAGQNVFRQYASTMGPEKAKEQLFNEFKAVAETNIQKGEYSYQAQRNAQAGGSGGAGFGNLKPEHRETARYLNDIAQGALTLDKDILDTLARQVQSVFGVPGSVSAQIGNDGETYLVWQSQTKKDLRMPLRVPKPEEGEEAIRRFKLEVLKTHKMLSAKDVPPGIGWIVPDWGEYKHSGKFAEPAQVGIIKTLLDQGNVAAIEPKDRKEGMTYETDKGFNKVIRDRIKHILPQADPRFKKKTNILGNQKDIENIIVVNDVNPDGSFTEREFNLKLEPDRKALGEWVSQALDWTNKMMKRYGYSEAEESDEPAIQEATSFDESIKDAKQNGLSYDDFINEYMKTYPNHSREEVEKKIGITRDMYEND